MLILVFKPVASACSSIVTQSLHIFVKSLKVIFIKY